MVAKRRNRCKITRRISEERMPIEDWHASERALAKLVARAYAADHPELFGPKLDVVTGRSTSGSSSTVRTEAVAPAAREGDLEDRSVEQHGEAK